MRPTSAAGCPVSCASARMASRIADSSACPTFCLVHIRIRLRGCLSAI
jgi:hypothetical protein